MLTELMKQIDAFTVKYGSGNPKMKDDLLDLIQKAIDVGADKDQSKISGIVGKVIKTFMGGGKE